MNSMRHLVLGAARSGKTRFALNEAKALARAHDKEVVYVATAEAHDVEMRERVERHRAERPANWRTLEAPRDLAQALASIGERAHSGVSSFSESCAASEARLANQGRNAREGSSTSVERHSAVVVIDCLTLWLSNSLLRDFREDDPIGALPTWAHEREAFIRWLENCPHPLVLVSNEVGGGIVPASALARRFQSEQGWLNQDVASRCERVTLVVAGLPVTIKAS